jgi:N-acetyl sugar amidotransferase
MIEKTNFKQCTRCLMDTSDSDITFDKNGVCNHCINYDENISIRTNNNQLNSGFAEIIEEIKQLGRGKDYDCIIGVSGGADSTYVAYKCIELGLRPLAVHFDNGWDSELAIKNIENVLNKLNIDLYTYVVDWEEYKDLQLSFLKASTPDSEIPTDHAIYAILMQVAMKNKIKYVISGMNYRTESIMPLKWSYGHSDWKYIKSIQKKFGSKKLKSYPHYSLFYLFYITLIKNIRFISLLNYLEYNKEDVVSILERELGWKNYGGKHHESIYTRFFQSYLLPVKFNIDKRKAHLSNLINSGLTTRNEAIIELEKKEYSEKYLEDDKIYVIKKFGITKEDFDEIMSLPIKTFQDYPNNYFLSKNLKKLISFSRKKGFLPK